MSLRMTTPFVCGRRYQIVRAAVQAGMKHQRLRMELRLDGLCRHATTGWEVAVSVTTDCGPAVTLWRPRGSINRWADGWRGNELALIRLWRNRAWLPHRRMPILFESK